MANAFDSAQRRPTIDSFNAAPLAIAGLVTVAALAGYLAPPVRLSRAAVRRRSLAAYLRDHLSGADAAIHVVRRLASIHEHSQDGPLFRRLAEEFEQDRATVRFLLRQLGVFTQSPKRAAGRASAFVLGLAAGGRPGQLSLLRTFEALAIGIQGKRCMWRALQVLETPLSPTGINARDLESKALRQWEAVEERRRELAATTFPTFGPEAHSTTAR